MTRDIKNIDAHNHVQGKSIYVDDIPVQIGTLYACAFGSPIAHGRIEALHIEEAIKMPGVVKIFTYKDIPGENQIGGIIPDEPLLAVEEVHFQGQAIALVIAQSEVQAHAAVQKITVDIQAKKIIIDPREAFANGSLLSAKRCFKLGDVGSAFQQATHVFSGQASTGGQEHLYIETQGAYAYPMEHGSIYVSSSTQAPTAVQATIAKVLGIAMHKVEVNVTRLGGGFGGKEDQATGWGVMVALATYLLQKPVKYILDRMEDMRMTGKRNPYSSDYKIALDEELNIVAFEANYFQNGGAAADLSPAILERTLFHANNSYFIPNVLATAYSCRTNLPPNTAFRGFGGPQAMFVIEAAIHHAAKSIGVNPIEIQSKNLLKDGDEFPYGQITAACEARNCWNQAISTYKLSELQKEIEHFNAQNKAYKKALSLMPICFGISFTNTPMNNARALVHIYNDGSVGISTGAVEMGQGVNTKMLQVAAHVFGINPNRIKLESTNTTRVANTSPSAASATADLNGKALEIACQQILERLQKIIAAHFAPSKNASIQFKEEKIYVNDKAIDWTWEELIQKAFLQRINLSAKGHYATPVIHFDKEKEKGHPFAYHVYGTAITTCTIDCIRGIYEFDAVKIVHDFGASMNRMIDLGQIEGALVQGIGWMTMEELIYNEEGRLVSNALSTYKIPDIYAVPKEVDVEFLNTDGVELAIFHSKAVGEPPLMYGIGAYFALRNAIQAFNPDFEGEFSAPMTPEKVLMGLYTKKELV